MNERVKECESVSFFKFFKFFKFLITFLVPSTCLDFQTFLICERQTKAGEDSVCRGRGGYYAKRSNFGPPRQAELPQKRMCDVVKLCFCPGQFLVG